ncbi:AsnC family transcriptional regulator [Streptomyces europaeiscabiei]|uniref:Lrp/AsnC family transcriptional regulator n=1 Tax=Streptomyces europaeiscabiei TaxID=146819 RepID=UPI0029A4A965|nr:AsnC family transcriptional regulator [Streptomyces europaeiscabiei]MDX3696730.1 AsnC family transcriptional regulator [Streptomyces europaeiscabiei]
MEETHTSLLSEDDLALIHALQLRPRASWTDLGRTLGVDPVTVARRFNRLSDRGEAWVSVSPGARLFHQICVAFVDIDCTAGTSAQVTRTLESHPHVITIERSADTHRVLATVATRDLAAMSRYALDGLASIPGIAAVRTRIVTHMFTEGGHWRIDALASDQRTQLIDAPAPRPADPARGQYEITSHDRMLLGHLSHDGRASHRSLAEALGTSGYSVKRRIDQLVRLRLLRFRCDFARPLGGWPVAVTLWATAPANDLSDIGHALVRLPETRNCAAISGTHNLIIQASLHSVSDVLRLETHLARAHPSLVIAERTITLRHDKLLGRILDPHGRSVGVVAPDLWSEPGPSSERRLPRADDCHGPLGGPEAPNGA